MLKDLGYCSQCNAALSYRGDMVVCSACGLPLVEKLAAPEEKPKAKRPKAKPKPKAPAA